jgi:DNA-binding transcriptional regulator GbsR (MarR family)
VAQTHALLYLSPKPMDADSIADTLQVARSHVGNSLKELQGWGIVRIVHVIGERREHYESLKDVWEMFQIILDERRKREIDPTMATLRHLSKVAAKAGASEQYTNERLTEMLRFFETMTDWYSTIRGMGTGSVMKMVRMGDKIRKVLGIGA